MNFSYSENGQGLVSYGCFLGLFLLAAGLVLVAVLRFFGIQVIGIIIAVIVGLWLLGGLIRSRHGQELLRQLKVTFLLLLTALRIYSPGKHRAHVKVEGIAWQVYKFYRPVLRRYDMRLELVGRPWPVAYGSAQFVEDIFHHLISNALKYGGTEAHSVIEIQGAVHMGMARYEVKAQGVRLSEPDSARVFNWFYRAKHSRRFGLGIGLSVVRFLVTRMGGECGVTLDSPRGNTFWFTLPTVSVVEGEVE